MSSDWLQHYMDLSQSLLSGLDFAEADAEEAGAEVVDSSSSSTCTSTTSDSSNFSLCMDYQESLQAPCEEPTTSSAGGERRHTSSVRFHDSVSVRPIEPVASEDELGWYTPEEIAAFKKEQLRDKLKQAERKEEERRRAKRRAKEERKLKIQQRRESRSKELILLDKENNTCTNNDKLQRQQSASKLHSNSKNNQRNNLLGNFLTKNNTVSPMEQVQDDRDAISVF